MKTLIILSLAILFISCSSAKPINGLSFIVGSNGVCNVYEYKRGLWVDDNEVTEEKSDWGIKFDVMLGRTVRPLAKLWKKNFYTGDLKLRDIPEHNRELFFGKELANKIAKVNPIYNAKRSVDNPWYCRHWFILRLPKWIPTAFFSLNTPWKKFYMGNKSYKCDAVEEKPYSGNDYSWTNKDDETRCNKNGYVLYLCPSMTIRSRDNE